MADFLVYRTNLTNFICSETKFSDEKKLVLIGHSIGAWICTDLMRQFQEIEQSKIRAVVCLFPTLMHIGKSPNGQSLGPLIGNYYVREFSAIV